MFKIQSSLRPVTLIILTPLPHNYCPLSPISLLARPHRGRFHSEAVKECSMFKVQCSKFLPLLFPPSSFLVKTNNHKKHQEKGTYYKIKSYLCTRKHVCRDSAITALLVKKSRQNSSRHSQGAVNKHVAFSDHYMLLVFSAGIDCLFRKTPHYLLR